MATKLIASDIMNDNVICLRAYSTLAHAWQELMEHQISGAPVVNENRELLGVLSQTDLAREAYASEFSDFPTNTFYWGAPFFGRENVGILPERMNTLLVDEVMTKDPICVDINDDIATISTRMRVHHIHRVIVMDKGKVAGIISSLDLLKLLENH
jgi:CBS domain-containing protein